MDSAATSSPCTKSTLSVGGKDVESQSDIVAAQDKPSPDGGFEGWLTVLGVWILQFTTFGYSNTFAVYQDYYTREFLTNSSASAISWIGSTQLFLFLSMGLFTGRLFDYGLFWPLMISGTALSIFCNFMLSLAKPEQFYQVFLAQGLGFGLGGGLVYVPALAIIAHHFRDHRKRTTAMTLAGSGSSLGGVILPIMVNNLFHSSFGFANGVRAIAGLISGLQILALFMIWAEYSTHGLGSGVGVSNITEAAKSFGRDPAYLSVLLGLFVLGLGFYFPITYFQLFALTHDVDLSLSFYMIAILNTGSLFGRSTSGLMAHYFGVPNYMLISVVAISALVLAMLGLHHTSTVALFGVLYGWFSGACLAMQSPMLAMLAQSPTEVGARIGIGYAVQGLGALIGLPIAGALLGANFVWWRTIIFSAVFCIVGTFAFALCRTIMAKRAKSIQPSPGTKHNDS